MAVYSLITSQSAGLKRIVDKDTGEITRQPHICTKCLNPVVPGTRIWRWVRPARGKGGKLTGNHWSQPFHIDCFIQHDADLFEGRRIKNLTKEWTKMPRKGKIKLQELEPKYVKIRHNLTQYLSMDRKRLRSAIIKEEPKRIEQALISLTLHAMLIEKYGTRPKKVWDELSSRLLVPIARKIDKEATIQLDEIIRNLDEQGLEKEVYRQFREKIQTDIDDFVSYYGLPEVKNEKADDAKTMPDTLV